MENEKPVIICLTPVRNEAWILNTFLECASIWADHIIIADQNSTDGSKEIALRYPKVIFIENTHNSYDERARQELLINEARKIPGKRLLIALDADEVFTGDFLETLDWQKMISSAKGSVFGFKWVNLLPRCKKCWNSAGYFPWAFMDDGSEHRGDAIHSPRVPLISWDAIIPIKEINVLHFQYIDWVRMQSKHRFYQCIERIKFPGKSAIDIYRMYHHMHGIAKNKIDNIKEEWFLPYEKKGIKIRSIEIGKKNWFDAEVNAMIQLHGADVFKKESIWDGDLRSKDPRSIGDKMIHLWLKNTTKFSIIGIVMWMDKILKKIY